MQSFSQGPGTSNAVATLSPQSFANKEEGVRTNNAGGWSVKVVKITGPEVAYSQATISLKTKSGALIAQLTTTGSNVNSQTTTAPYWWIAKNTVATSQFWDYETSALVAVANNADVDSSEFENIEGVFLVLLDNDANNKVTAGDTIMVFKSNDNDGVGDVESGATVEISKGGDTIGSVDLN
jgi:hypothetical protein